MAGRYFKEGAYIKLGNGQAATEPRSLVRLAGTQLAERTQLLAEIFRLFHSAMLAARSTSS